MQVKFLRRALVPVLGALVMNSATANPFEGVDANKYCLSNVCLGAPLSSMPEALKDLAAGNKLAANPCKLNYLSYYGSFDASGRKFQLGIINDPSLLGKPVGEYYRIASVIVLFEKPLTSADTIALDQELKSRMQLNSEGRRNIVSSYKGLMPRQIVLSSGLRAFEVKIERSPLDFDEIRAYEDAPGCKADKKPNL